MYRVSNGIKLLSLLLICRLQGSKTQCLSRYTFWLHFASSYNSEIVTMKHMENQKLEALDLRRYLIATRYRGRPMTIRRIRRTRPFQEPPWLRCALIQIMVLVVCSSFISLLMYSVVSRNRNREFYILPSPLIVAAIRPVDIAYIDQPWLNTSYAELSGCNFHNTSWSMVIFVKSQATNFNRREMIRRTWASLRRLESGNFTTFFVVGKSASSGPYKADQTQKALLEEEKDRYHDILHYDGPDDYKNIGFKTLTGMRWASENLQPYQLYATADDDFMLNIGELQEVVDCLLVEYGKDFPLLCGFNMFENVAPVRNIYSKWFVTIPEYPNATYPKFCLGGMYVMNVDLVTRLWQVAKTRIPMRVDDVWITGILREEIGVHSSQLVLPSKNISVHLDNYKKVQFRGRRHFMWKAWTKIFQQFVDKPMCQQG